MVRTYKSAHANLRGGNFGKSQTLRHIATVKILKYERNERKHALKRKHCW